MPSNFSELLKPRRVDVETLMKYFASVAEREGAKVERLDKK